MKKASGLCLVVPGYRVPYVESLSKLFTLHIMDMSDGALTESQPETAIPSSASTSAAEDLADDADDGTAQFLHTLLVEVGASDEILALSYKVMDLEDEYGEIDSKTLAALTELAHACDNAQHLEVSLEVHFALKDAYADIDELDSFAAELASLGDISRKLKRYEDAETFLREALSLREEIDGENHPHVAFTLNTLASVLTEQGKFDEAKPLMDRSLDIFAAEVLSSIMIKNLDCGTEAPLSKAEKFLPKGA